MLKTLWNHRRQIAEGVFNSVFVRESVEQVATWRKDICQSNKCGYYDKEGASPKAILRGSPACSICGCQINILVRSMSSKCSLHEIGLSPLWDQELTQDEENNLPKDDQIQPT